MRKRIIEITHTSSGRFKAIMHVPEDLEVSQGSATEQGAWVEGTGDTPDTALRDLYCNIGQAYARSRMAKS